jgi:hypothetical protein
MGEDCEGCGQQSYQTKRSDQLPSCHPVCLHQPPRPSGRVRTGAEKLRGAFSLFMLLIIKHTTTEYCGVFIRVSWYLLVPTPPARRARVETHTRVGIQIVLHCTLCMEACRLAHRKPLHGRAKMLPVPVRRIPPLLERRQRTRRSCKARGTGSRSLRMRYLLLSQWSRNQSHTICHILSYYRGCRAG